MFSGRRFAPRSPSPRIFEFRRTVEGNVGDVGFGAGAFLALLLVPLEGVRKAPEESVGEAEWLHEIATWDPTSCRSMAIADAYPLILYILKYNSLW